MSSESKSEKKINEALYSRQLYVFGHEAQAKLSSANVLIMGLRGLGVEIAKNVILAGVNSVVLHDPAPATIGDLGAQFYLKPSDVGKARAEASLDQLASLNPHVKVSVCSEEITADLLKKLGIHVLVVTEQSLSRQIELNELAYSLGIKFVSGDIRGVFAAMFVDFGNSHLVTDPDGEEPRRGLIVNVTQGNPGVVTCHEDNRHGLVDGDYVTFEEVEGMVELNGSAPRPVKVITPYSFSIEDTTNYHPYTGTRGYFQQVKMPTTVSFKRLKECVKEPKFTNDVGQSAPLHVLYQALGQFMDSHSGRLPQPHVPSEAQEALALARKTAQEAKVDLDEKWAIRVLRCSASALSPMAAFAGGVLGQEVLKACSGKFTPMQQQLYFDASLILPDQELEPKDYAPRGTRYDEQAAVIGWPLQEALSKQSMFLVGAGAIGCEMLKNWALMGIATSGDARVTVTDMDNIEMSNLNRQFLFRMHHIGQLKSKVAAEEAMKMNPEFKVHAEALRVAQTTEHVFNDAFWEKQDVICTALDNVEARLYVDSRCIQYRKPMVDSGTLGTKGNTQVMVPFLTESYGSSRDPPEESIPICTLKNFPHKIEHTIQWARDAFEGWFKAAPEETNNYISNPNYLEENAKNSGAFLTNLQTVHAMLVKDRCKTWEDCIRWARLVFQEEFHNKILQLITTFPPDHVSSDGTPFWSGPKRVPSPIIFDVNDPLHFDFIVAAAHLRAFNFGIKPVNDPELIKSVLAKVEVPEFKPSAAVKIATTDAEAKDMSESSVDDFDEKLRTLQAELPPRDSVKDLKLCPVEFEKDDDTNFHMAFITACSNLRARNYKIKEVSMYETKRIAGKIIPAIATTTALVTGLVCLEIFKILQKKKLEDYRNTYVNLALPLVTMSEPFPPAYTVAPLKDGEWKWSLWDRMDVDLGDCTLRQLIQHFEDKYGLEISMLSYGPSLLFMNFGMSKKKIEERLNMTITKIIEEVTKSPVDPSERYLVVDATVNTLDGEDVNIPSIRLKLR